MYLLKTLKPSELTWRLKKKPSNLLILLVRLQETLFSKIVVIG